MLVLHSTGTKGYPWEVQKVVVLGSRSRVMVIKVEKSRIERPGNQTTPKVLLVLGLSRSEVER